METRQGLRIWLKWGGECSVQGGAAGRPSAAGRPEMDMQNKRGFV